MKSVSRSQDKNSLVHFPGYPEAQKLVGSVVIIVLDALFLRIFSRAYMILLTFRVLAPLTYIPFIRDSKKGLSRVIFTSAIGLSLIRFNW